eukprot:3573262-Karenia_brevis.AAC.1
MHIACEALQLADASSCLFMLLGRRCNLQKQQSCRRNLSRSHVHLQMQRAVNASYEAPQFAETKSCRYTLLWEALLSSKSRFDLHM